MAASADGPVPGLSEARLKPPVASDIADPLTRYPRMMNPHQHVDRPVGLLSMRYMLDERIKRTLSALMGEAPLAAQSMFYFKPPGSRGQDFHQDNFYLRVKPGTCLAAWFAIDRCDEHNGGMMLVPETGDYAIQCPETSDANLYFTTEHVPIPPGKTAILPVMEPGDVLFFNGSTVHGSGPNRSEDRFRRSLIFHYVPQSTTDISHWYQVVDFAGRPQVHVKVNQDGGPCGTLQTSNAPH